MLEPIPFAGYMEIEEMKNEPVACDCSRVLHECSEKEGCRMLAQLNTHPAKTLTDEEIEEFAYAFQLWQMHNPDKALEGIMAFARAILRKASEK